VKLALAVTIVAALAGRAHADRVVALAPLATIDAEDTSGPVKKLTAQLESAIGQLPGMKVVTAGQVADAIRRAKKPQLRVCEGDVACLADLGKLVGAQLVVAGQIGGLGESKIVYLNVTDVASGKEIRSTTLALGAKDDRDGPIAAVVRLLDPNRHRGTLHFVIDAAGATVFVNGSRVKLDGRGSVSLAVGTQAVRVTHPEYRDFVRFIDVEFNKTTEVRVDMTQYPIVRRDIQGNPINRDGTYFVDPPVWRRWYVVGPAAIGLAILTGVIVGNLVHDLPSGPCRIVGTGNEC